MTRVLAPLDPTSAVEATATALARLLAADVRHVDPRDLAAGVHDRDVVAAVVSAEPGGALAPDGWERVAGGADRPVAVVPRLRRPPVTIDRVLVPLDGSPESAAAAADTVGLCAAGGADLVVLHVFDARTVPRYWDQAAHARADWEREFLARWCAVPGARLHLRSGVPGEHVADVARVEAADLIALGWSGTLAPGRARTVRRTLAEATVPVLLIPAGLR
ncbi:universal stress protein [Spirilliplanes yamanashiensis]|uniref:universal stress protein n=1 Tax=Spirilliplanes yamanashiensis TaxID=42233 RepID=UPI00194EBCCC|nr:universal stress protein [Spirilliplanes yamanashiensis]MDP9817267.1 nucleotide-binding universal stress UspA family protein [Spirilliplanes yamanashiensis]